MRTLYLSGPMTGIPDFNRPAFNFAAGQLRTAGYIVINPADNSDDPNSEWIDYIKADIAHVFRAHAIATLRGWQTSKGALIETTIAHHRGIPVAPTDYWLAAASDNVFPDPATDVNLAGAIYDETQGTWS